MPEKHIIFLFLLFSISLLTKSQDQVIKIWPGFAPGSDTIENKEQWTADKCIINVFQPDLSFFLPKHQKKPYFWAAFSKDEITIMIQEKSSIVSQYKSLENKEIGGTFTLFIQMFNVKEYYEQISDKVKIVSEIHTQPYSSAEFAIKDCNGYILTFAEMDQ